MPNPHGTWKKGQSGNPKGRPPNPEAEELRQALAKAKKERGISLVQHCVNLAYDNPRMAAEVLKKIAPDLHKVESDVQGQMQITVVQSFKPEGDGGK